MKKLLIAGIILLTSSSVMAQLRAPNLSVVTEGTRVSVFWDNVIGAEGYNFYFAPYPSASPITIVPVGVNKTSVSANLFDGAAYYVAVTTRNADGESKFSNIENFSLSVLDPSDADADESEIISNIAETVILSTYEDLQSNAEKLLDAVSTLNLSTTEDNLIAARQAWRNTRRPWEQTETFLFGPVDSQGIDPAIDSWPVNRVDLDAVLDSANDLTTGFVSNLDDTLKGFHTIEYLLFGGSNDKVAADLTAREKEYLIAVVENLVISTTSLADAWRPGKGNFIAELQNAGTLASIYISTTAALQELVEGMIGIADEVGNGKIADPFSETDTELVESQFSYNSLLDFADNIRGIENVYLGRYLKNDGPGLSDMVRRSDPALDDMIRDAITGAIKEIQAIPFPFRDAISIDDGRAQIETAITAVLEVQTILESELLPFVTE